MNERHEAMKKFILIAAIMGMVSSCTTYRAFSSKTQDDIGDLSACVSKKELTKKLGDADQIINVPGGGYIEVHEVLLRNPETTRGGLTSAFISIGSLGIVDATAGLADAAYECGPSANSSGIGAKCDYTKMRYIAHYPDAASQQMACLDAKEVRVGSEFYSAGDQSRCPKEYKEALSKIIDVSEMPASPKALSMMPGFSSMSVREQLNFMAAGFAQTCAGRS